MRKVLLTLTMLTVALIARAVTTTACVNSYNDLAVILDGTYYLRNVATGKYWGAGNIWGTQFSLVDEPVHVTLYSQANGTYIMETMVSNGGANYYFNGEWMDGSPANLTIAKTGDYYTFAVNGNCIGYNGSTTLLSNELNADDENALWEVLTEEELFSEQRVLLLKATATNPVEATFLISDPRFDRNRRDFTMWNYSGSIISGPNESNANYCIESYHSDFSFYQLLSRAPKGIYKMTAQGIYRQDGSNDTDLPVFFANDQQCVFPIIEGSENSMALAGTSFDSGLYTTDPIFVQVINDGDLTIGTRLENNISLWCIWDNFSLTYYGDVDLSEVLLIHENEVLMEQLRKAQAEYERITQTVTAIINQTDVFLMSDAYNIASNKVEELNIKARQATSSTIVEECTNSLKQVLNDFLSSVTILRGKAFDLTGLINNAGMDALDGWKGSTPTILWGGVPFSNAEFFNKDFDIYQVLDNMPKGNYRLKVQAFQRPGSNQVAYDNHMAGFDNINSYIYINDGQTKIKNVMSECSPICYLPQSTVGDPDLGDYAWPNGQGYTPNGMEGARLFFDAGYYENEVLVNIPEGELRFGFRCSNHAEAAWTLFDNFRLYYSGTAIDVTLDEDNDLMLLSDIENANVTLKLNVKPNEWNAIVLPFDLTMQNIKTAFGQNAEAVVLNKNLENTLMFSPIEDKLQANEPFLLKTETADSVYMFDGCPIFKEEDPKVQTSDFVFIGNYNASLSLSAGNFIFKDGILQRTQGSETLKAYHAYILSSLYDSAEFVTDGLDPQRIDTADWLVLKSAYSSMNGGQWYKNWNIGDMPTSTRDLPGVTAHNGHVTGINLSNNNLSGAFPISFLALSQLQHLNLSNNHLSGDIGVMAYAFAQQNPELMANLQKLNISGNQFSGNMGIFANCFPNLHTLDASGNCFEDVYPMIPTTVTTLDIGNQTISRVVPLHLSNLSVETIATKVPSILLYDHQNQIYTPNINLLCTTQDNSWGMIMSYQNGQLAVPYVSEQNTYYGQNGDTLNVALVDNNGTRDGSTFRIALSFDEGDGNFDGQVNVLDLQTMINYMFEEYTNNPYNFTASNLWKDDVINIQDAVCMVNKLLTSVAASASSANSPKRVVAYSSEPEASVYVEESQLIIDTTVPVSAFDIIISTSEKCEVMEALAKDGFICAIRQSGNETHLVGYSLNGTTIPKGKTAICSMNSGIITYAMLSDKDAQEISSVIGVNTTAVQSSMLNSQSNKEVYRIPIGAKRAIIIDAAGNKTMTKDVK